ncbi:unnamed protein product [Closterium sp. NIES-64]|nr:unnamed protein product [Closterium sp. NIES-64]
MDGESWRGKEVVVDSHAVGAAVVDSHAVGAAEPLATRTHAFHLILFPPLTPSSPPPPCTGHQQRPSLGAPFNAHSPLDSHVPGGLPALKARWQALLHQIRVCDSSNYLKAFQASDVLVVVGWSSDLLPFARRNNNITVAAPADGTLLFADLWAVPATARYNIPKAAWRNRGPSPLIGQWMKFCLQPARAVPLEREIFSAFSPTGQTMQGRVKQAIEAVGSALDKLRKRG